jgi:CSLREA domain-containing protein
MVLVLGMAAVFPLARQAQTKMVEGAAVPSATFTVNSTADATDASPGDGVCATSSGVCTLRAAIQEANALVGADTIILPAGTYALTIPGTGEDQSATGDLDITEALTINGAGANSTIVDGGALDHVFHVRSTGQAVTLTGMTIQNGNAPYGDGIIDGGGGIRSTHGAQLTIIGCHVINNHSTARGGGIFSVGRFLRIMDSQVSNNSSQGSGGGLSSAVGNADLGISNTQFIGNASAGWAGGIDLSSNNGHVSLDYVTLSGNTSGGYGGAAVIGGDNITVDMNNSQILDNQAASGAGAIYYSYPDGGTLTIANTTFAGNELGGGAAHGGGAILMAGADIALTISNSRFTENISPISGGGIATYANNSSVTISNTEFLSNTTNMAGGAFLNYGDNVVSTVTGSTFTGNSSVQNGGVFYIQALTNTATIADSYFGQNHSGSYGGVIRLTSPDPSWDTADVAAHISGTTFKENTAVMGGAIASATGTYMAITNTTFLQNMAGSGGAIFITSVSVDGDAWGDVVNSTFSGNQATGYGGAIYGYATSAELRFKNVTLADNVADSDNNGSGDGGGIAAVEGAEFAFANSIIANNVDSGNQAPDCFIGSTSQFISLANNLVGKTDGCTFTPGPNDLTGTIANPLNPHLEPLAGSPAYYPLSPVSPAIDAGFPGPTNNDPNTVNCPTTDQPGNGRPIDGNGDGDAVCDMGAVEAPERFSVVVNPAMASSLVYTDTHGNPTTLTIPAGAVTETTVLFFTPVASVSASTGYLFAGHAFDLEAYVNEVWQAGFVFNLPITISITYADEEVMGFEDSLVLLYQAGGGWDNAACGSPVADMENNTLSTPVCHLSRFALFGIADEVVYLPVVVRP